MTALFRVAIAAIAVHVVDDSFLQPQPGTSAGDHLVSGLVPLVLLALAARAYPRLRGGRRGATALALGVLGIAGGIEAVHYTREVGASGDDYSGLLALAAGVLLLGVGLVTLWRTRRMDGGRGRRYLRRALLGAAGALGLLFVALVGYAYVTTHVGRPVVPEANLGTGYEEVSFTTSDGLELSGWYVPSRNRAAVIVFPGRKGPQAQTRMLARHGYGALLFDRRGEGSSDGDPNSWGWGGEKDIKAAIAFLRGRADVDPARIGGLGLSVGGELMLQTAAETDQLKAVVSEGAGLRSVRELLDAPGSDRYAGLPLTAAITTGVAVFSNHAPPASLKDLVARIAPRPLFLISAPNSGHGEELNTEFFEAAREPRTLWEMPDAGHTGGIRARPREYERRVVSFFDDALLP